MKEDEKHAIIELVIEFEVAGLHARQVEVMPRRCSLVTN